MEVKEILQEELLNVEVEIHDVEEQISMLLDKQERVYERQSEIKALLEASKESGDRVKDNTSTTVENWSGAFEWDYEADDVRFTNIVINFYHIINVVMSGRYVMVIMAAGGGKNLCYQLLVVLRNGVTLVISPLLSLIQDQEEEKFIYKVLEKGEGDMKILYVTPEKISKSKRFMSKLEKCHHAGCLSLISIDVIVFLPLYYKNLGILETQFPNVPVIALNATAIQKVQNDLMEMLCIPKCVKFVSTVNRPNIFIWYVQEKSLVGKVVNDEIALKTCVSKSKMFYNQLEQEVCNRSLYHLNLSHNYLHHYNYINIIFVGFSLSLNFKFLAAIRNCRLFSLAMVHKPSYCLMPYIEKSDILGLDELTGFKSIYQGLTRQKFKTNTICDDKCRRNRDEIILTYSDDMSQCESCKLEEELQTQTQEATSSGTEVDERAVTRRVLGERRGHEKGVGRILKGLASHLILLLILIRPEMIINKKKQRMMKI
ncbi:hypothetical protein UlMin_000709 [Ulmus minor]